MLALTRVRRKRQVDRLKISLFRLIPLLTVFLWVTPFFNQQAAAMDRPEEIGELLQNKLTSVEAPRISLGDGLESAASLTAGLSLARSFNSPALPWRFDMPALDSNSLRFYRKMGSYLSEENVSPSVGQEDDHLSMPLPLTHCARLEQALMRYERIEEQGGWPYLPAGPVMQHGDCNKRVSILRKRLLASGDLAPSGESDNELFDDVVADAVRKFQQRHGLEADGIVGPRTLIAFNVPVEERIQQIKLNMERWRQFPDDLGDRYILVNTANSELKVVENSKPVMAMRTVVGRPDRPTPVLSGEVTELVLNPYWYIPPRIAEKDILPKIHKNPNFLSQQRIRVFEVSGNQRRAVDPAKIDWSTVTANNLPYRFRQEPGPANALGRVKFLFPNKFKVYIHDTPARELFQKAQRNFSSGCIRIEQPLRLAEYVLQGDKDWTPKKIHAVLDSGTPQIVRLPEPIPVYLLYWTAWVNDNGIMQFRRDVYGRDRALAKALQDEQANVRPTFGS